MELGPEGHPEGSPSKSHGGVNPQEVLEVPSLLHSLAADLVEVGNHLVSSLLAVLAFLLLSWGLGHWAALLSLVVVLGVSSVLSLVVGMAGVLSSSGVPSMAHVASGGTLPAAVVILEEGSHRSVGVVSSLPLLRAVHLIGSHLLHPLEVLQLCRGDHHPPVFLTSPISLHSEMCGNFHHGKSSGEEGGLEQPHLHVGVGDHHEKGVHLLIYAVNGFRH